MTPSISIRDMLNAYGSTLKKTWAHDRSKTVGASEIGQCARKTWFDKHNAPRDASFVDSWGARLRGTLIEDHYWVPAMRASLPQGWRLLYAGDDQQTLVDEYLSATTDGLLVNDATGECVNLDCKSIDPRANLQKEKAEHSFQVQVQMGLIRLKTAHQPTHSIVSYIDASFFDDVAEFRVPWDSKIYRTAEVRAERIMTERDPIGLPPEGKMSGGDECKFCAWASHCADVTVAGVPTDEHTLSDNLAGELRALRDAEREAAWLLDDQEATHAAAVENIKQFLREHDTRKFKGEDWSVSYSTIKGRETLDIPAIEAAGIDLCAFKKTGKPSERLTVK